MTRLQRIEGLLGALAGRAGVAGCTLASRVGLGGLLYDSAPGNSDSVLVNTIVSSLLRVGEKLGEELHGRPPDYHWLNLGGPGILLVPCGEEAALVVRIDQGSNASPLIEAALGIAKQIPVLLKDRGET